MFKTIEEKFKEEGSYILELPLNEKHKLFVEGLSENGEAIQEEDFNVDNIKKFCVEIINAEGEALCSLDASKLRLYNSIEKFTDLAKYIMDGILHYTDLQIDHWYFVSAATRWAPEEWDYTEIEIEYDYQPDEDAVAEFLEEKYGYVDIIENDLYEDCFARHYVELLEEFRDDAAKAAQEDDNERRL